MADNGPAGRTLEPWTTTLDRIRQNLSDTIANTVVPEAFAAVPQDQEVRVPLRELAQRLAEWEACLQRTEQEIRAAEAASAADIAAAESWAVKMAEVRIKLARETTRAV